MLAVTLLNIHESQRFKKGAFRFWECLPVYKAEAATNAGATPEKARKRAVEDWKCTKLVFTLCLRQSASCVPRRRIDLPTARCI